MRRACRNLAYPLISNLRQSTGCGASLALQREQGAGFRMGHRSEARAMQMIELAGWRGVLVAI